MRRRLQIVGRSTLACKQDRRRCRDRGCWRRRSWFDLAAVDQYLSATQAVTAVGKPNMVETAVAFPRPSGGSNGGSSDRP